MIKHGDFMKGVKDFFERSFCDGHTLEVKSKTDSGVAITGEGKLGGGKFASKLKLAGPKINNFAVDKVELASKGTFKAEAKIVNIVDALDATFALEDGTAASGTKTAAKVGVNYVNDTVAVTTEVDVVNGPAAKVSAMTHVGGAHVGFSAALNAAKLSTGLAAFSAYDILVGYKTGGFTGGVEVTDKLSNVTVAAVQKNGANTFVGKASVGVSAIGKAAAKPDAAKASASKLISGVNVQVGASRKVDSALTVFGAVNDDGLLKLAALNTISPAATLLLSADVQLKSVGRDVHSVSTKFSYSA